MPWPRDGTPKASQETFRSIEVDFTEVLVGCLQGSSDRSEAGAVLICIPLVSKPAMTCFTCSFCQLVKGNLGTAIQEAAYDSW